MTQKNLINKIKQLKKKKKAILLVHNYQWPEIYQVADFIGDSLELSKKAMETKAEIIIFCGVDFMAESAKLLNSKMKVLLPVKEARCPMAAMVSIPKLLELKKRHPQAGIVGYVNTSAETKSYCDICCTSANAVKIVASLPNKEIIFLPDKNLALYVQSQLPEKKIIPWPGFCYVHSKILDSEVKKAIKEHPTASVLVHPECPPAIINLADYVCSTSQMIKYAQDIKNKEFIIVTEAGMINRLQMEVKNKKFYAAGGFCIQMKKNSLAKIYDCLKNELNEIIVPKKITLSARRALTKMLLIK